MHCVDLGESFQTHTRLQNLISIQPRTRPLKFEVSLAAHLRRLLGRHQSPLAGVGGQPALGPRDRPAHRAPGGGGAGAGRGLPVQDPRGKRGSASEEPVGGLRNSLRQFGHAQRIGRLSALACGFLVNLFC